jgi:outer membrane protein assembly factor BamB
MDGSEKKMNTENGSFKWGSDRLWNRIAMTAGVFALMIGVLMIANYIQLKKADPVNMSVIISLVERLHENPQDSALREEIRALDLLYRKAYFTSQWQIRIGGYILLASIAVMIIALQLLEYRKKITPVLPTGTGDETMFQNRKARKWIVISGSAFLITAMVLGFLSSNDMADKLRSSSKDTEASLEQDLASGNISVTDLTTVTVDSLVTESEPSASDTAAETASTVPTATIRNDNFPNFRGIGGTGIASKSNIPVSWDGPSGSKVLWKTAVPLSGHSSPVIWADKVFVTGASVEKTEVYCFDCNSGKLVWSVQVGNGTKKPKVSEETGYAAPTAVTDGNGVYAIFSTGDVAGISLDGKKIWERDLGLPDNHYGHASSLAYANGNIIIQFDQRSSQKIMALSAKTGQTVWSTNRPVKTSWSSPIVVNTGQRTEIITVAEPYVAAYNPVNGQELWKIEGVSGEVGPSLAYANGIVFAVNDYSRLCAIKLGDSPTILWENNEYLSDIPSPAANEKYLFLATSYGTAVCYDAISGQKYWEHDFNKSIFSSPMIVANKVYLSDITGVMHIFAADKEFRSIGESKLGEYIAATPAFTSGRIYLRGEENLYCIGE